MSWASVGLTALSRHGHERRQVCEQLNRDDSDLRTSYVPDVRCRATLDPGCAAGQCQLYVGHEGEHAVVCSEHDEKVVRRWRRDWSSDTRIDSSGPGQLPWAPSFPMLVLIAPRTRVTSSVA